MNKSIRFLIAVAVVLLAAPLMMAQTPGWDGYNAYNQALQTKMSPAGYVNEPGSQLIYLLDTGVNAKELFGDNSDFTRRSVSDLGSIDEPFFQNFISVTNTNPTDAITVHFRYMTSYRVPVGGARYTQVCEDVLDFLVVLTCNDTMLVDPFNYTIPGSGGLNTRTRFFGSVNEPGVLKGLTARAFDDGRFFLFVTASGNINNDGLNGELADIRYPAGLVEIENPSRGIAGTFQHCGAQLTPQEAEALQRALESYTGSVDPITGSPIVESNLHILNASAVSFNFLTGFSTIAIPTEFLGTVPGNANDLAYGVTAIARVAEDLTRYGDNNVSRRTGNADGIGIQAEKWVVLSGGERIWDDVTSRSSIAVQNDKFLSNTAHNGDTQAVFLATDQWETRSNGGALGWTLFPIESNVDDGLLPANQFLFMVSMVDDYNGSDNQRGFFFDNSYALNEAQTIYNLEIYNNDEELLAIDQPDIPVSPPPDIQPIGLQIVVQCFDAFDGIPEDINTTEWDDFSVADLFALGGAQVQDFLKVPVAVNDEQGPGWIRFLRVTSSSRTASGTTRWDLRNEDVAFLAEETGQDNHGGSFLTIAQVVNRFEGFGASYWAPTAAYLDPARRPRQ